MRSAFARGAGLVLVSQVAGTGLSYLTQVLLARWAGTTGYGLYSYALAWAGLLSLVAGLGWPQALVRFIPEYETTGARARLRGLLRRSEQFVLGAGVALAFLGAALVASWSGALLPTAQARALFLGMGTVPLLALLHLQTAMCRARQQMGVAYAVPRLLRPLLMIGGAYLVVHQTNTLTGPAAVAVAAASVVPLWLVQRLAFRLRLPRAVREAAPAYALRSWLRVALPLLLVAGFADLLRRTDLLMVGFFMTPEDVGFYKVASRTASVVGFVLMAVNAGAAPRFAALHAAGDRAGLQRFVSRLAHWIFWPSLLLFAGLVLAADLVLGLFGPAFSTARTPLIVLAAGQLVNAGTGSVGYLLNMTGHHRLTARVHGVTALMNIALNLAGLYFFGLVGAALATALCTVGWNVWLHRRVTDRLHVAPSILSALRSSPPPPESRHGDA